MEESETVGGKGMMDIWKSDDLIERLCSHPDTIKHMADPGFMKTIEILRETDDMDVIRDKMKDPRITQAFVCLTSPDMRLVVSEDDLKTAERKGEISKRSVVQLEHISEARNYSSIDSAKDAGNSFFKKGDYSSAVACYRRAVELSLEKGDDSHFIVSVCRCNEAMALLRLSRWEEAEEACNSSLENPTPEFNPAKSFFRRSVARERMGKIRESLSDMKMALRENQSPSEEKKIASELSRLERALLVREESDSKEVIQKEVRKKAQPLREKGKEINRISPSAPSEKRVLSSKLGEIDLSSWIKKNLEEELVSKHVQILPTNLLPVSSHIGGVFLVELTQFKGYATAIRKAEMTSLFYDVDVTLRWSTSKVNPRDGVTGVIRVYNVGQDTSLCLGGDTDTSYMYQLGYDRTSDEKLVSKILNLGNEMFETTSIAIDRVLSLLVSHARKLG